jgi:hypothetical protein
MLMIGLAGSLACAGLIAGTVIKLANIRRKRRRSKVRRKMWDVPFNTHRAPLRLETESLPVELDEEPWPLQPFEEPEPAPETLPRWLQIARARFEADRASEEIEGLLSRASRTATH